MSYPRYQEYIKSGVEWLGETPSTWTIKRVGYFFNERREKVSDKDFQPLSVTKNGIVPQLESAAKSDDGDNRKKVCIGDFVINSRSDRKGSSGASVLDGSVSLINTVIVPNENIDIKFAHNLFRSTAFQEEYYRYGKGIVADLWSTNYSEMKNISIPIPSLKEQRIIADFLENETSKIDYLVAEQEKLIELLKEKRQTVISKAVTKGINPKVKMKDSGVAWLGEVPEHWEVTKIKYIATASNGLTYSPDDLVDSDDGVLVLRSSNIQQGKISLEDNVYVKMNIPSKSVVKSGDILICSRNGSRALIGKNALIPDSLNGVAYGAFMMLLRSDISRYIYWILNSFIFEFQSSLFLTSTINQLTVSDLYGFEVPIPPKSEQGEIIKYLQNTNEKLNSLIDNATKSVALLQERRSALISAAVTGQIDVRNYQPKEVA